MLFLSKNNTKSKNPAGCGIGPKNSAGCGICLNFVAGYGIRTPPSGAPLLYPMVEIDLICIHLLKYDSITSLWKKDGGHSVGNFCSKFLCRNEY